MSEGDHHPERRTSVHVIVTCANRKSLPIPSHLQLGEVPGSSAIERARTWIARLADTGSAPQVPAFDLYAGEHWSVARKFKSHERTGEDIRLWAMLGGLRPDSGRGADHALSCDADARPGGLGSR